MQVPQTEVFIRGAEGGRLLQVVLPPGEYVIGREAACDLPVEADLVSRRHALLTINFDHAIIEDLCSSNGTAVNGKPVLEATRLWPNQKIQVGSATIELRRRKSVAPPGTSLAPTEAVLREILPEEFLHEKRYEIGEVVARGGMGAILDAKESTIERKVAMKVMLDGSSPDDLIRFVAEARVTGQLEHPNIVPVHELGVDENGQAYYTMKFVRGITLRKVLQLIADHEEATARKYPLGALLTVFQKVSDALAFTHSRGVVHRDLKPDNIMLGDFGEVLVMDWGLAKVLGRAEEGGTPSAAQPSIRPAAAESATMTGSILGTPQYMAPEQARGEVETLDARADVYALGAILYHILALRPPIEGEDAMEIVEKVGRGETMPLVARSSSAESSRHSGAGKTSAVAARLHVRPIPDSLAAVVRKAMAFDRAERYARVVDLQLDIASYQNGFATRAEQASLMKQILLLIRRHRGVFGTALVALLVLGAMGAWFILSITASEHRATRNAEVARAAEKEAIDKQEATRRALAKAEIAVADAAYRRGNAREMRAALQDVPEDLRDPDWSYLTTKSDDSIAAVLQGMELTGVAVNPKAAGIFVVGGRDGKITILRPRSGEKLLEFTPVFSPNHQPGARDFELAISPDGNRLAIGHNGDGILLYGLHDGKKLAEWDSLPTGGLAGGLFFSPDGRFLLQNVTKHPHQSLILWDAATGKQLWSLWDPREKIVNLASPVFTPDGEQIVCIRGATFLVLNARDGTVVRELKPRTGVAFPQAIAIASDGKWIVAGALDGDVLGLALDDGGVLFKGRVDDARITQVAFTPDGNRFVVLGILGDGRQSIQLWKAKAGRALGALLGGSGDVRGLSVHPLSGEMLLAGKDSRLWNAGAAPEIWTSHNRSLAAHFWGSDDILFAAKKGGDGRAPAELWDLRANKLLWEPVPQREHEYVTLSADGRFAAVIGAPMLFLHWKDGNLETVNSALSRNDHALARLSPDGNRLLITTDGGARKCEVLDSWTGQKACELNAIGVERYSDFCWVAGGARCIGLATTNGRRGSPGSQEKIILWDAVTGQQLQSVSYPAAMDILAVSPDGLSFAEAGEDRLVRVRDAATLAVKHQFRVHDSRITALAWHPKKPILATGSSDLSVKIWNLETGRSLEEFHGFLNVPNALSFSPGGTRLACSVTDEGAHVWEPPSLASKP